MSTQPPGESSGTCFVVMGFGKKTDFETGRTLDLDKSYRNMIKPAVEAAGLKCIRADEIVHSGLIDVPMYEQLLKADVVVADLSTANPNAFYELGVRHALRPYTTVVISEDGIKKFPFDVSHVAIRQYRHMGEGIDFDEVMRFRKELTDAIVEIRRQEPPRRDSPVYAFLDELTPPTLAGAAEAAARALAGPPPGPGGAPESGTAPGAASTHSALMQQVDEAQKRGDFRTAKSLLEAVRAMMRAEAPDRPEHPDLLQRLALVTYKGRYPSEEAALLEARGILAGLHPRTSNDPETLGLWGAVHKRLWELAARGGAGAADPAHLDEAVRAYERGFYLRNDYYNGINFAYLLNLRAAIAADPAEAVADFVQARRVRAEVLAICDEWLAANPVPEEGKASPEAVAEHAGSRYWVLATRAEATVGLGEEARGERMLEEAYAAAPQGWMADSTREQVGKLRKLLEDSPLRHVAPPSPPGA